MVMDTSIRPKINLSIDVEDVLGDQFLLNSLLYDLIDPEKALCDGAQSVTPDQVDDIMTDVLRLCVIENR